MKRLLATSLALALALALPAGAEAQTRVICLTTAQATCVEFSGVNWTTTGAGATASSSYAFSTLRFFGSSTLPSYVGLWWNQADNNGDSEKIGFLGDPSLTSTWGSTGSWDSGNIAGSASAFWKYPPPGSGGPYSSYQAFAGPGAIPLDIAMNSGDADVVTQGGVDVANGFSLFDAIFPSGLYGDCEVQAPITYRSPDGQQVAGTYAGIFAMFFQTPCFNGEGTTVPEPAAVLLLASTLVGLGFVGRRRKEDELLEDDEA